VLTGVIVAVLLAAVATGGDVELAARSPQFASDPSTAEPVTTIPPLETDFSQVERRAPLRLPDFVDVVARIVFALCLAAFAVMAAVVLWRHRPRLRWPRWRRAARADFDVLDDVAASVTADAEAQRAALERGTPRNAIVECWLRLESAVIAAGVERAPADTSAELTERVLATRQVDGAAISTLAALYREARFSAHSMGEGSRSAAIEALDIVHDGLRAELGSGAVA
jgi:hypothetical protein